MSSTHALTRPRKIEKTEILGFGTFLKTHNAICSKNGTFWKTVLRFCSRSNSGMRQLRNMTLLRTFEFQDISDSRVPDSGNINICTDFELKFYHEFKTIQNFWIRPRKFLKTWFSLKCVGEHKFLTSNSKSAWNSASNAVYWYMIHSGFAYVL